METEDSNSPKPTRNSNQATSNPDLSYFFDPLEETIKQERARMDDPASKEIIEELVKRYRLDEDSRRILEHTIHLSEEYRKEKKEDAASAMMSIVNSLCSDLDKKRKDAEELSERYRSAFHEWYSGILHLRDKAREANLMLQNTHPRLDKALKHIKA